MRNILLPGDSAVTAAALEDLTMDLRTGERVADALRDFCVQILEGAGIASNQ